MSGGQSPDDAAEIEDILADLDAILSGQAAAPGPPPAAQPPDCPSGSSEFRAVPDPGRESSPAPSRQGQAAPAAKRLDIKPSSGPSAASVPSIPASPAAPPPRSVGERLSEPSREGMLPPGFVGGRPAANIREEAARVQDPLGSGPPPGKAGELKIELSPRAGILRTHDSKKTDGEVRPEEMPGASARQAFGVQPNKELSPPDISAQPSRGQASPSEAAGPAVPETGAIPPNAPKEQVRRVAFLYAPEHKAKYAEFMRFIDSIALHYAKKPLYLRQVLVLEVAKEVDAGALLTQVRNSGAVGAVGLLGGVSDSSLRTIEEVFSRAGLFLRLVPSEDVLKRSAAVDLLVDMMLLNPD